MHRIMSSKDKIEISRRNFLKVFEFIPNPPKIRLDLNILNNFPFSVLTFISKMANGR